MDGLSFLGKITEAGNNVLKLIKVSWIAGINFARKEISYEVAMGFNLKLQKSIPSSLKQ